MHRCAAPRLIDSVGAAADSIFSSALARASGLRVNCALIASARYSRLRLTARASTCAMIGASSQEMIQTTSSTSSTAPAPPFLPPRDPPPAPNPPASHFDAPPQHPRGAVVHQCDGAYQRGERRHQPDVQVLHVPELVADDPLQLLTAAEIEE